MVVEGKVICQQLMHIFLTGPQSPTMLPPIQVVEVLAIAFKDDTHSLTP